MRLIDVDVVLNLEEGNQVDPERDVLKDFSDDDLEDTKYAILSHCWYRDKDEVQFREMEGLISDPDRQRFHKRPGYQKILKSCELARENKLHWLWVDTCCINKDSSAELTEAINSMFRWYDKAEKCYTYLHDVKDNSFPTERKMEDFPAEFKGWPKWFSRGWTLQGLVAPRTVVFFNHEWQAIGNKKDLASTLEDITCIPSRVLKYGMDAYRPSIAQVMSWAADRKTKRVEDRAYSLLGLFGVHMPMLYGEGKNAFRRLQLELIRMTNDHSIFAWERRSAGWSGSVLADDPSLFRDCDDIVKMEPDEYLMALKEINLDEELHDIPESESLRTYSITNAGIQISLPLLPLKRRHGFQSVFEARLACRHSFDSLPIAVVFTSSKSNYYRAFGDFDPVPETTAQFRPLYLAYREQCRNDFTFKIDDSAIFYDGFVQRCVFPNKVILKDSSVKLSNTSDLAIIVYVNDAMKTCFAVAVGYFLGHVWVHVLCDDLPEESKPTAWKAYAKKMYKHHPFRRTPLQGIAFG
ncbi:hypothetical protein SCLCIDRAFT_326548 [Scleroderma citrinum Foug A]|uniref:Uncharacterized protein n=1 Tax=Scleroderma citrinum Foug A TaxID=1036808 RepID=A0A0C2ZYH7_9AGAM|nr:hypothetical protein SCLCIDRAFT_326548 [Scleroderma citrinum Foug A]